MNEYQANMSERTLKFNQVKEARLRAAIFNN
jgi:hypothetical protein